MDDVKQQLGLGLGVGVVNVRVTAAAPGPMRTSKVVAAMSPDMGGMGLTTAFKRTSYPTEVAHVVAIRVEVGCRPNGASC